jgi:putative FmdB family regulatory protein
MPLYEYRCENCRTRFEVLRSINQSDDPIACPACAEMGARRLISTFAAISKGNAGSRLVTSNQTSGCGSCAGGHCATCGH